MSARTLQTQWKDTDTRFSEWAEGWFWCGSWTAARASTWCSRIEMKIDRHRKRHMFFCSQCMRWVAVKSADEGRSFWLGLACLALAGVVGVWLSFGGWVASLFTFCITFCRFFVFLDFFPTYVRIFMLFAALFSCICFPSHFIPGLVAFHFNWNWALHFLLAPT